MKFKFGLSHHGDVGLDIDDKGYNLGYNYLSELPIMLFLNHKQNNFGNLFKNVSMPKMNSDYIEDYELEEMLEKANGLSQKLPISVEEFNQEIRNNRLSNFNDGFFYESYNFSVNENSLLLLSRQYKNSDSKEVILRLDKKSSESLAETYFKFIADRTELEKFQGHLKRIFSKLT